MNAEERPFSIVLFDGVCNLCNRSVRFIIARDPQQHFRFAALQSAIGRKILHEHSRSSQAMNSVLLLEGGRLYDRSTAVLRIARRLNKLWPLAYGFILVPRPIRDAVYRLIANNRYRLFGKSTLCLIPTGDVAGRFLEG